MSTPEGMEAGTVGPDPTVEVVTQQPELEITSITYKRLWNLGNYENISIDARAIVHQGEDPSAVFRSLRSFVDGQGPGKSKWGGYEWDERRGALMEDEDGE